MSASTSTIFETLNHTELFQLCQTAGVSATAAMTREELAERLLGLTTAAVEDVMSSWRHGLAGFVLDHWTVLQNQIRCPLRTKDPRSCFGCLDAQVIACLNDNAHHLKLIQLHRKWEK